MDSDEFAELVRRWEERDKRWEVRDKRWEERDREYLEFMREMWRRVEEMDIRQQAAQEHLIGRLDAGTEAIMRMLDRFGEGPLPSS